MNSIPVLGTAIVNTPTGYIGSAGMDYPVENFVVFNNNGRGQINHEVDLLREIPNSYVKNVYLPPPCKCWV